jgi:hypothetical protein
VSFREECYEYHADGAVECKGINKQCQFAFRQALNSDTQGYKVSRGTTPASSSPFVLRRDNHPSKTSTVAFPREQQLRCVLLYCTDGCIAAYALREIKREIEPKRALLGTDNNSSS